MKTITIIGAGAAGQTAAILAGRLGLRVILLEHTDRTGRKILSTGNGKCNFTNRVMNLSCYRGSTPGFPGLLLERYGTEDVIRFFESLGIVPAEKNGYYYPRSGQAASVQLAFAREMAALGTDLNLQCRVSGVTPLKEGGFRISADKGEFLTDAVLLACGSKAAPVTGSDGSGYELAKALGHRIITPLPALVQLRSREKHFKKLSGVRTDGRVSLFVDGKEVSQDKGELQFTEYGISGIPVFQVSRYAAAALHEGKSVSALLDFAPDETWDVTAERIRERLLLPGILPKDLLCGWLPDKLSAVLLEIAGIRRIPSADSLKERHLELLLKLIRSFRTDITGTNSFEQAQVCSGGVDAGEIDPATMESLLVHGLYFAGEILDVDGICGGYNLSFAVMSAMAAVKAFAKD